MPAVFRKCARCFNEDGNDDIFMCNDCGTVFCEVCEHSSASGACPKCKGDGNKLGSIEFPEED